MNLEELLNKLIELGWNGGEDKHKLGEIMVEIDVEDSVRTYTFRLCEGKGGNRIRFKDISLNDLVSIDSGLWQFVCEKELFINWKFQEIKINGEATVGNDYYFYWLMKSATYEDKTQFILDNIKLD